MVPAILLGLNASGGSPFDHVAPSLARDGANDGGAGSER
jgi:hypothetical protein